MNLVQRKLLMGTLVAAFCAQTALVYLDDTADDYPTLTEEGVRGRRLWHRYNCQACHQIHGFGGFLGPDLTNAAQRLTNERLHQILTVGNAQMPAFHFDEEQIADMTDFLDQLDEMGVGVARGYLPIDPMAIRSGIEQRLRAAAPPEPVQRGFALFSQNCAACHVPLQATPLGLQTAPDLTTATRRLDDEQLRQTIEEGRPDRGMLPWKHLGEPAVSDLIAFVKWLNADRPNLAEVVGGVDQPQPLPWWEYR